MSASITKKQLNFFLNGPKKTIKKSKKGSPGRITILDKMKLEKESTQKFANNVQFLRNQAQSSAISQTYVSKVKKVWEERRKKKKETKPKEEETSIGRGGSCSVDGLILCNFHAITVQ